MNAQRRPGGRCGPAALIILLVLGALMCGCCRPGPAARPESAGEAQSGGSGTSSAGEPVDSIPGRGLLPPRFLESDLGTAVAWMAGSFSSQEQADADTNYFDIRLEMKPIWPERKDGYWLYVEQAVADYRDRPYRQRVYHVTEQMDGLIRSDVYEIPDPMRFAGAWDSYDRLGDLTPDSLVLKDGCAVILERVSEDAFEGGTVGNGCPSSLRGAGYATSQVRLTAKRLITWDRGYDTDGNQVWGATKGGYVFNRISRGMRTY